MRFLWRRVTELLRPAAFDRDAAEELAHHIALRTEEKRQSGLDPLEARRQALVELGSIDHAREQLAEGRTGFHLEQLTRDVIYGARVLRRTPIVSLLSIAMLALAIGVSALLFSVVDHVLLQPLPYPTADRLVRIFDSNAAAGVTQAGAATGNINDWRSRTTRFETIAATYATGRTLSTDSTAEVVLTAQVTEGFFDLFGVSALLGRTFTADEAERAQFNSAASPIGADPVVLLSEDVWRQHFGADPNVLGRTLTLERRPFRVVGVMPAGFAMPDRDVKLWIPWSVAGRPRDQHFLIAIGLLKPGVSVAEGAADLNRVATALGDEYPATNRGWRVELRMLTDVAVGGTRRVLWILLAAVGLVLVVVCANIALLSLTRGIERANETALRLTLGAAPSRLLRQFFVESALLAATSGALGVMTAAAVVRLLPVLVPDIPRIEEVRFDARAVLFALVATGVAALASGGPAARRRIQLRPADLLSGTASRTMSAASHTMRDAIVVAQIAMAVVLMVGSGLLIRSFMHLRSTDSGFDPRGVLVLPIFLDTQAYSSGDRVRTYYQTLFEELAALPGVVAVGGGTTVPTAPLGPGGDRPVWPEGATDPAERITASTRVVTPGYFKTLGMSVIDGRAFDATDRPDSPGAVMVSETLAARLWPGRRATGQRLVIDYSGTGPYASEVIGVVKDVRFRGPKSEPRAEFYLAHAQRSYLILNVALRSHGDPRLLIPQIREVMKRLDPQKPAHGAYALEDLVGATIATERQVMLALATFAVTTVLLAVISVYGVLSHRVRERAREIGIRMAIGADATRVVGWVARRGLTIVAIGLVVGLVASAFFATTLSSLLYGVRPLDPTVSVLAIAILAAVGLLATLVPAWRAARIDPVTTLRQS